ncbi:MAG: HEAT repeat domain-containing protein [bacterium]
MSTFLLTFLLAASLPDRAWQAAGFDSVAGRALSGGLAAQGADPSELGFYKQWAIDSFFRLKVVDRLLDNPLECGSLIRAEADAASRFGPGRLVINQWSELDAGVRVDEVAAIEQELAREKVQLAGEAGLPAGLATGLNKLLAAFAVGQRRLDKAVAKLQPHQVDRLIGEAVGMWGDSDDTTEKALSGMLNREFGRAYDTTQKVKAETLQLDMRAIDRYSLGRGGTAVVMAAMAAERAIVEGDRDFPDDYQPVSVAGVEGDVLYAAESQWGPVVVGGPGPNVYRADCAIIVDLGGDDLYLNRAGGAVGLLGPAFSVVIDLGGDDRYTCSKPFAQGAALFGCGVLVDRAGNDVYRAGHCAQGAAMYGTACLLDRGGDDILDAGFYVQGSGYCGVGTLVDGGGNDSYRAWCYAQGFGGTWGYGLCSDRAGNDNYYAGGRYKHEPLLPFEYRSFAQGFAIGARPDAAGGIGFLCDVKGNDFYNAEVFCQATSYWYSLGMLWDGEGFDHYTAAQYSQGAGIHLSVGVLVDEKGNDSYFSRLGPSQGQGHDLSVGVLLDAAGDDGYYASGGQGIGLTNSVGLLLDSDGNDWYVTHDSLLGQGSSNAARGFGGMGLFADLAGTDRYTRVSGAVEKGGWTKGTYGSGTDLDRPATIIDLEPDVDTSAVEDDSIAQPVESLFATASLWEVGNVQKKVKRARKQLAAAGRAALDYAFDKKADTKDGLELRAMEELVKAMPDTARPYLYRAMRDERLLARSNAAYLLGKLGRDGRDGVDSILAALEDKRISPRRAVGSLGDVGDSLVVPRILYLLRDSFEPSRIVTAEACAKLKNPAAVPALIEALSDRLFTVRSAAEMALVAIDTAAAGPLLDAAPKLAAPALGHCLRGLGTIAARSDSVDRAGLRERVGQAAADALSNASPFVRLVAVEACRKVITPGLRARLEAARPAETDVFVLNQYRLALNGH